MGDGKPCSNNTVRLNHGLTYPPEKDGANDIKVTAVNDHDYMTACSKRSRDPFIASGEYWVDHWAIRKAMKQASVNITDETFIIVPPVGKWRDRSDHSTIMGTTRHKSNRKVKSRAFYQRLLMAGYLRWSLPARSNVVDGVAPYALHCSHINYRCCDDFRLCDGLAA